MASAFKTADEKNGEDELDTLFKDFDKKLHEVQQKFSDIEKDLQDLRKDTPPDEEEPT
ncbi:MAG: hypothetical protein WCQ99_03770 [Pseudomonadota bacterium]